jgi:hypothetical protein
MRDFQPYDYQRAGIAHMLTHERCALHAGMGTGKTPTTLMTIDALMLSGAVTKTLVVAPLRVAKTTWPDEVRKWRNLSHLRVSVVCGTPAERTAALKAQADIYTINYENLPWLRETLGDAWPFDLVVADESTKLKSFRLRQGGQRARALGQVAHKSSPGSSS